MKKILFALSLLASIQLGNAQVKALSAAQSAVQSAQENTLNPKKAEKPATWIKLGQAYMNAYNAPAGNVWIGASKQELALVMGDEKPSATEVAQVAGEAMEKEIYETKNLYFNSKGILVIVEITKQAVENPLGNALDAYKQAYSKDLKKSKTKEIADAIGMIAQEYVKEAYAKYSLGMLKESRDLFAAAAEASSTEPSAVVDSNSIYNAGFTSWSLGEYDKAQVYFEKCAEIGYLGEDGETYAKLGDVYNKLGKPAEAKKCLEDGFVKYPQSQSILIGLINYYVSSGEDSSRLFELIAKAQQNEPNNASLYYVEGNINEKLGNSDKAVEAYRKCAEINPNYEFGYIGEGILFYNKALKLQEKAQEELDDAKYMALNKEFEAALKDCISPFEKAYNLSKDNEIRVSIAEYLKNAYFRFREESEAYKAGYEKYANIVSTGKAE